MTVSRNSRASRFGVNAFICLLIVIGYALPIFAAVVLLTLLFRLVVMVTRFIAQ